MVGTKSDLLDVSKMTNNVYQFEKEYESNLKDFSYSYIETSSKNDINIKLAFKKILEVIKFGHIAYVTSAIKSKTSVQRISKLNDIYFSFG